MSKVVKKVVVEVEGHIQQYHVQLVRVGLMRHSAPINPNAEYEMGSTTNFLIGGNNEQDATKKAEALVEDLKQLGFVNDAYILDKKKMH